MKHIFLWTVLALAVAANSSAQQSPCEGIDCPNQLGTEAKPTPPPTPSPNSITTVSEADRTTRSSGLNEPQPSLATSIQTGLCPGPFCKQPEREEKTEFQKFVFANVGEQLPIFGREFFSSVPSTFAPVDRIPVPANYIIGPGDELLIRGWGQVDINARVTVDRDGQVYLPKVGAINVVGIRNDQITGYLKNSVGRVFKNFDLNVTLGQLRSIQVFVVGQAKRPGTYTISSLSTLVNALFASGGPSVNGSMRHILLKRQGHVVTEFDLYDLLLNGDKSKDVALLPGDVIYIPPVGKQIAIFGSVNVPGIYEMDDSSSLGTEIEMAGGLSTTADGSKVLLERIEEHATMTVSEFKLDDGGLAQKLRDGDILRVFPISPRVENSVILRGNVALPGRYPWHTGMRVSDVIPSREAIVTREYWMRQNALARSDLGWSNVQRIASPNEVRRNPSEINWDYAVIQRLNHEDLSSQLIPFNLGHAIADASSADNLELRAGDVITIFSQSDLMVPVAKRTKFVTIEGEVKSAGVYRVEPGETLRHLVKRAGGLTNDAYLYGADFRRESTRLDQQKRLEQAVEEMQKQLQTKSSSLLGSAAGHPDEVLAAKEQIQAGQQLVDHLRSAKATGRIVLGLHPDDDDLSALPDIELEDGDVLNIPARPSTVAVIGAVYNQSSFLFKTGSALREYLNRAGGPTREADNDRTFVIRADGSVVSSQMHRSIWSGSFESLKVMPGDTAIVPERIKSGSVLKSLRDWSQVFAQFALGAAAIQVIKQ